MSLASYHKKRDFKKTIEPKATLSHIHKHLYIIQKHTATHLHYDFRLELNGVLLSWAVPKGPCLQSGVKRLAIQVEDHPVAYGFFEGIIPKGQYGGGTVMLWDQGIWKPLDENPTKAYQAGHLRFELVAKKLKGRWDLIRFKSDRYWFLIKYKDNFAKKLSEGDILVEEPNSVLSQQAIEEISRNYQNRQHGSNTTQSLRANKIVLDLPDNLRITPFPEFVPPQLTTLVDQAPEGPAWLHEVKFDGYRMLAFIHDKKITLKTRHEKDWTSKLMPIVKSLKTLCVKNAIFDGEVVLLDQQGKSDFQFLQNNIKSTKKLPFIYYIFDILYYDRFDLKPLALLKRKEILKKLLRGQNTTLHYSDHIINNGGEVFKRSCKLGLEGIVSKRLDSQYITQRTKSWLKIKCLKQQEFVIGGYSQPKHSRTYFGALYLGVFNTKGELNYVGKVGTGFTNASLAEIYNQLQQHLSTKNPFNIKPPTTEAIWVKPVLVAEVEFIQWTADGHLRHPSFKGLRLDKKAKDVKREQVVLLDNIEESVKINKTRKKESQLDLPNSFKITNPTKILYPDDQITKQDLLNYYETVSKYMLPFIKHRPLSLVRCPASFEHCFFQRHYNDAMPQALKPIAIESKGVVEQYIYLANKEGLLSLVQLGVLEIHPWGSKITSLETPDLLTIDLDPAPDIAWKAIVTAAFEVQYYLKQYKLRSFVKTTGGKGLHVVIPIQPEYNWEEVKKFTHIFVQFMEKLNPSQYISKMTKSKRNGKIFIDYLRNQRGATAIGVYSTRALSHAPVAVPLHWDELSINRQDTNFTIKTLSKRLNTLKRDPWHDFWKIKQSLHLKEFK